MTDDVYQGEPTMYVWCDECVSNVHLHWDNDRLYFGCDCGEKDMGRLPDHPVELPDSWITTSEQYQERKQERQENVSDRGGDTDD